MKLSFGCLSAGPILLRLVIIAVIVYSGFGAELLVPYVKYKEVVVPKSIQYFEWLFLFSLAIGLILAPLSYHKILTVMHTTQTQFVLQVLITYTLTLSLIFFTSRKRSNVAKWLIVAFFVIGLPMFFKVMSTVYTTQIEVLLSTVQVLSQFVGVGFLFAKDSREYFQKIV